MKLPDEFPRKPDSLDESGDVRIPDDLAGFDPQGFYTRDSGDLTREEAILPPDGHDDDFSDPDEIPVVAVDLGFRATNLLLATDSLTHASILEGLLKSGDRRKIIEYGGEASIRHRIKVASGRGRQALRAAYGLDVMLENPQMVLDEDGYPYTAQDAYDDEVQILHSFRRTYTADAYRSMPPDASLADKLNKKRETDEARYEFRRNLARQVHGAKPSHGK